ncbi:MAG: glutathione S-transferase family protein [Nannocystis sp.]|nr:glutathione S-transferase family protein [Nannocystis sp.]MBA3550216.1 glutathione S-transferase family protein [Nannocystis sp.]
MKLYHSPGTSAFRCRWMLEELGTPYELVNLSLGAGEHKRPEYLQIHPLGSVPALVDGDNNFIESAAIVMHLADQDPEQRFAPALASPARGHYYQWILFAMTSLYPAVHNPYLRKFFRGEDGTPEEAQALARQLAITDELLARQPFLLGESFSAADIVFGGQLVWADACGLLQGREPHAAYLERLRARPAFQRAAAH